MLVMTKIKFWDSTVFHGEKCQIVHFMFSTVWIVLPSQKKVLMWLLFTTDEYIPNLKWNWGPFLFKRIYRNFQFLPYSNQNLNWKGGGDNSHSAKHEIHNLTFFTMKNCPISKLFSVMNKYWPRPYWNTQEHISAHHTLAVIEQNFQRLQNWCGS
jgi:hypothetical protein